METSQFIVNKKNDKFVHYQKINILGEPNVGKSSLIALMENYDSDNFQLDFNSKEESFDISSALVEQTKLIEIDFNEDKNLYFNVYETSLDRFDSIRMNLDILLLQTECIIIMWDNNSPTTFENIPPLISAIEATLKQREIEVPIFVLQNKMDLPFDEDEINDAKDKLFESINKLKNNSNVKYKEISLKDNKDNFYELIVDIGRKLSENSFEEKKDIYNIKYYHPLKPLNKNEKSNKKILKCVLLGSQGAGKTSFLKSLVGESISDSKPTNEIGNFTFSCKFKEEKFDFIIIDTVGQERYTSLTKSFYREAQIFLLFFDVTDEESFNEINYWIEGIEEYEFVLVANKIDETENRCIGKKKGKDLAKVFNVKYLEISCLKKI